jgi:hypothetical protein
MSMPSFSLSLLFDLYKWIERTAITAGDEEQLDLFNGFLKGFSLFLLLVVLFPSSFTFLAGLWQLMDRAGVSCL